MALVRLHKTVGVKVGRVQVGGGAPIVVQSMTMTDTADAASTAQQCIELAEAGSEMVRVTVNNNEAAAAIPEIKQRMLDAGCQAPLIGDFHYNGHLLLTKFPACADALDKYRINPGNVGKGANHDKNFATMVQCAVDHQKPVRIGVNAGSLDQELLAELMDTNARSAIPQDATAVFLEAMVQSALRSAHAAEELDALLDKLAAIRKAEGKENDTFEIHVISMDAYTVDGCKRLEDKGITDVIVGFRMPYIMGPDTEPLQKKIDHLNWYGENLIAQVNR